MNFFLGDFFFLFIHKLFKFRHIHSMIKRGCQNIINKQHKLGTAEKNFCACEKQLCHQNISIKFYIHQHKIIIFSTLFHRTKKNLNLT